MIEIMNYKNIQYVDDYSTRYYAYWIAQLVTNTAVSIDVGVRFKAYHHSSWVTKHFAVVF